ncbi:MAG: hypothetical protein IT556_11315 [Acetobacteraceae bacterium]|nr:hypothetical protein [Acetobacteraceae bacterium]
MPVVLEVERGQSESAFDVNLASYVYVEQALQPTRSIPGRTAYQQEVTRLTGWTFNSRGDSYANPPNEPPVPVRWGGTSFVDDWILPPADLTPLASNGDPRLAGLRGEAYFQNLDAILAAHAAAADAVSIQWFRQTWESSDPSWPFDIAAYARAITLFTNFEIFKCNAAAPGKPAAVFVVMPGQADRGGLNHALIREVHLHLAVNGRRSSRPSLGSFPVLPHFRIATGATLELSMASAYQADTGLTNGSGATADNAHQSAGSTQRTGMARAIEVARWLAPVAPRPFDRAPVLLHAFRKPGTTDVVRLRVRITPNNFLAWQGPAPEDSDLTVLGGFSSSPSQAHIFLHQGPIDSTTVPTAIAATAVTVDNADRTKGWGYLDITLAVPVPANGFVSLSPSQNAPGYTRRGEAIAPSLKRKIGLYEALVAAPDITAGFPDLLGPAPSYVLPLVHATNVPITQEDPATMADLTAAGITLVENWLRTQITHAGLRKSGTEVSAAGYARAAITWSANGAPIENTNQLDFGTAITDTGIDEVAGYTAATGGSAVVVKAIPTQTPSSQVVRLAAGALDGVAA